MRINAKCGICESSISVKSDNYYEVMNVYNRWKDTHNKECIVTAMEEEEPSDD